MTKYQKVQSALVDKGLSLTSKQISSRFNIANPYDAIYFLRNAGYNIVVTKTVTRNGTVTNKYSHVS